MSCRPRHITCSPSRNTVHIRTTMVDMAVQVGKLGNVNICTPCRMPQHYRSLPTDFLTNGLPFVMDKIVLVVNSINIVVPSLLKNILDPLIACTIAVIKRSSSFSPPLTENFHLREYKQEPQRPHRFGVLSENLYDKNNANYKWRKTVRWSWNSELEMKEGSNSNSGRG